PEEEGVRYELDEGELIVTPTARPRHNLVRDNIADPLRSFFRERGLGEVFRETDVQLSPQTVRIPDAAFVTADRMKQLDLDRRIAEAPALVIEVVSPTDLAAAFIRKVNQYLAAGAQAVWVVYAELRQIHVFGPGAVSAILREQDVLEDQRLFPGFSLPVREIFE
ncbi:MAG: hypothetical protein DMG27_12390, partial [Acidobacteria bacterium]